MWRQRRNTSEQNVTERVGKTFGRRPQQLLGIEGIAFRSGHDSPDQVIVRGGAQDGPHLLGQLGAIEAHELDERRTPGALLLRHERCQRMPRMELVPAI